MDEYVVLVKPVPSELSPIGSQKDLPVKKILMKQRDKGNEFGATTSSGEMEDSSTNLQASKYTIRQANELSSFIRLETIKSLSNPIIKLKKFIRTEYFSKQLEHRLIQFTKGRDTLNESVENFIPKSTIPKLEKHFKKKIKEISRHDFLGLGNEEALKIVELNSDEIQNFRLKFLGVKFKRSSHSKKIANG